MPQPRLLSFLGLLAIFLSGALSGVFGYRLYETSAASKHNLPTGPEGTRKARTQDPEEIKKRIISEMRQRIRLDDAQVAKLNRIFDDTRAQFDQIHQEMNDRGHAVWDHQVAEVKAILRPDQVPLYDQLRAEHEAARKRRQQQDGDKK
jgi:hypothetical protein